MTGAAQKEKLGFQTEVRQLLSLMIHSLYSNKEIFLRELISNASDAADKLRFEALSDDGLFEGEGELQIRLAFDKEARTVTITDNGIGMSRQEVIDNIGTIAKSGTRQFFEALTGDAAKDAELIGQFGVGFYSAFIVADRVTLITRRAGVGRDEGVRWESDGEGEYTVETVDRARRGTQVVLHLREDQDEFLDGHRLRHVVGKYSDHISLPIIMDKEGEEEKSEETINSATALWTKSKSDITQDEYDEFYKHVSHDFEAPMAHVHTKVEGNLEYISLLYIPTHSPFDLWDRSTRRGIKLYVRRIFITDDAEHLMPSYLRFVRGVIDSADLPLNISREILQHNKQIDSIRGGSVKKILGLLEGMLKNDTEKYAEFWREFGRVFKEGLIDDPGNREAIAKLMQVSTTHTDLEEPDITLDQYVERMEEGQEKIYYITAANFGTAKNSPHLEVYRKNDIEVLLLCDDVDEIAMMHLGEYQGHQLQSVTNGDLDLGDLIKRDEDDDESSNEDSHEGLVERIKASLGERVQEVRVTDRLTSSPACLVAGEHEMSAHLERLLKASGQNVPNQKPILEINPNHGIVKTLTREDDDGRFNDWTKILFDQALLSEGGQLEDPSGFVRRLNQMLAELYANNS